MRIVEEAMVVVDEDLLRRACPDHGGWYADQLRILKVPTPPKAGWRLRVVGTRITRGDAFLLVALRNGPSLDQGLLFQR